MVPHSSPGRGPRPLSAQSSARFREAVRDAAASGAVTDDAQLRQAIAVVVAEARERGMHPEELIPAFRALLDSVPELHASSAWADESRIRERLVTLCIKAYYGA